MLRFLLLVALWQYSSAQTTYDCQCGFFVEEQAPGQVGNREPIPFRIGNFQVDPLTCSEIPEANNTCRTLCNGWGQGIYDTGLNLCDAPEGVDRCYGGLFCEGLVQEGNIPETGGLTSAMRVYYRNLDCAENSGYEFWRLGDYAYPDALCCSSGGVYGQGCDDDCDCNKAESGLNYCECGIFTEFQFIYDQSEDYDPLPFKYNSSSVADPIDFCEDYNDNDLTGEPCEEYCNDYAARYFASYVLLDPANKDYNVAADVTYGQLYCDALGSRYIFPDNYVNTEIQVYKRAMFCAEGGPLNAAWQEVVPETSHPERLCCNQGAHEFPCSSPTVPPAQ